MNKSLFYILRDFADWTGIPGLVQIINALNVYILFAWLVCFGAMWGVFIYEMVLIVQTYFSYSADVFMQIGSSMPRDFPVITICNQNPMNYTMVQTNSTYSQINQLIEDYLEAVQNDYGDIKNDQFGLNVKTKIVVVRNRFCFQTQQTAFMKGEYAREALFLIMNGLSEDKRRQVGYQFDDFFFTWYWNKAPTNDSRFTSYLDPTYGLCYQFNAENMTDDGLLKADRAGTSFGLRAVILVHQYSPSGSQEYLPLVPKVGLRVGVDYYNSSPTMESVGIDVKPGTETWIKLKYIETSRASKPYGTCVESLPDSQNYYSAFDYTMDYCLRTCIQAKYIQNCSCANPLYLKPFQNSYCTIDNLECVFGIRTSQAETGPNAFSPLVNCSCNPSCSDKQYKPVISIGRFPSNLFSPKSQPGWDSPYACTADNLLFGGSVSNCIQWFQDNAVVLNIYFSGIDYISLYEGSNYTLTAATNDLGGQMGLWVGTSIICVLEIFIFFIVLGMYFVFGRRITDVEVTDMHRQKDKRYDEMRNFKEELDTQEIMDDEIKFRYRELQMRPERKRLERLDEGYRLNELAVKKAAMKAKKQGIPPGAMVAAMQPPKAVASQAPK
ncbi:Degenerin-like protein asic-2 [Aphelenchoides bicaudatus]|nr:Degenerin-like protein asic-2 [Aphelenchoides bicaudatus]